MVKTIHCIEVQKEDFDEKYGISKGTTELRRNCIGFMFPEDVEKDTWNITCMDGTYVATGQDNAEIISNQEMIKAMLMKLLGKSK